MHKVLLTTLLMMPTVSARRAVDENRTCFPTATPLPQIETVRIVRQGWSSSDMLGNIGGILAKEILGYKIEYVDDGRTTLIPELVSNGTVDLVFEFWPAGKEASVAKFSAKDKGLTDNGLSGVVGRSGMYMSQSLAKNQHVVKNVQECAEASYKSLDDANVLQSLGNCASHSSTSSCGRAWCSGGMFFPKNCQSCEAPSCGTFIHMGDAYDTGTHDVIAYQALRHFPYTH